MSREFNEKVDGIAEKHFPTGVPFSSPDEIKGNEFINKAIRLVKEEMGVPEDTMGGATVYVVWFVKVLQNWKAMVSTDLPDGRYYEVTYNGDKGEAYVDTYVKILNTRRPDNDEDRVKAAEDWLNTLDPDHVTVLKPGDPGFKTFEVNDD